LAIVSLVIMLTTWWTLDWYSSLTWEKALIVRIPVIVITWIAPS
jgi:hypothetical protein